MIHAAEKGYAEIVQALVAYHVNLNYVDDESGWTALMYASRYGHTDTVTTLLKAGCTLEVVDRKRNTALLLACFNRHWATAEVLIDHGVDLNAVSDVRPPLFHLLLVALHAACVIVVVLYVRACVL